MNSHDLRLEVENLYADYVDCLDNGPLDRWPEFFTDECVYEIVTRENIERKLPLALMRCESRGMLIDRVVAVQRTSVFSPRTLRHVVSSLRVRADDRAIRAAANFAVFETVIDEPTRVFVAGRYLDQLVRVGDQLRFARKQCVLDSPLILGSLIYPI